MSPLLLLQTDPLFGLPFARAAYLVIFGALFAYLLRLHLAHRALARRLEEAERRMEGGPGETG
jgi:CcmD family protein